MKNTRQLLLLIWFCGVIGFLMVISTLFIAIITIKDHTQIVERMLLNEPNNIIFWIELVIMLFVIYVTLWILYNYITGKAALDLVKRR